MAAPAPEPEPFVGFLGPALAAVGGVAGGLGVAGAFGGGGSFAGVGQLAGIAGIVAGLPVVGDFFGGFVGED